MALTSKQRRFIEEYLVDLNGTQAAIRAGYSRKTANRIASENLSKPDIQAAVAVARRARAERTQLTADNVLNVAAAIAFFDIRCLFDERGRLKSLQDLPQDVAVALASYEQTKRGARVRMADKIAALTLLFKHLGLMQKGPHVTGDWDKLAARLASARKRASFVPVNGKETSTTMR